MAIFREYVNSGKDRSAEDRRRHKELVEKSIKKNIGNIIAEESIIGQNKDKKIKIPIKGIKEYRFIYGNNGPQAGSGDGNEKRGDKIGEEKAKKIGQGDGQAGNQEGEDIYETEVTIEELIKYLFDDLNLPDIDRKKLADVESIRSIKNLGYKRKGIPPRLAKKRSVIEKIKRKQGYKRNNGDIDNLKEENNIDEQEKGKKRFPFMEDDLRYRRVREDYKKDFNAVVICIMDVSGSMDQTKKYMARSFYFLLYQFIRLKYSNVEVIFVAHTTVAKEVNEDEFFHKGQSGGTYISSGYEKALEIIEQRYNPSSWNIYAFHCSDGDNWSEDNKRAVDTANKLCEVCNLFGYGEIVPGYYSSYSTMKEEYKKNVSKKNFSIITMTKKDDILPGLKKLLEKEGE
ncbi:sporulation protein YhbH [Herbivorax sp. ANBcel31]|uniref:sporulation protein YhbH n=1 Tax=Herbivorax sp. ANBcel31 TaxID=3069754 RepID=UPI0027B70C2D|nr:sporulation protein YhbH [Herbivorax sp. ANBcel31]MDQ2085493.1 sporulation protein YhbH [Herbivorax sp. ANBcel31]